MKRSATDLVVILTVVAISVAKIIHPESQFKEAADVISNIVTTVVGALVGFIGGRAAGRIEGANGK